MLNSVADLMHQHPNVMHIITVIDATLEVKGNKWISSNDDKKQTPSVLSQQLRSGFRDGMTARTKKRTNQTERNFPRNKNDRG